MKKKKRGHFQIVKFMQKIKNIVNQIEREKETMQKIVLLKQLDDEVSKVRKELITKFQKENK